MGNGLFTTPIYARNTGTTLERAGKLFLKLVEWPNVVKVRTRAKGEAFNEPIDPMSQPPSMPHDWNPLPPQMWTQWNYLTDHYAELTGTTDAVPRRLG